MVHRVQAQIFPAVAQSAAVVVGDTKAFQVKEKGS